jgi:class 3 adenylate cyclase
MGLAIFIARDALEALEGGRTSMSLKPFEPMPLERRAQPFDHPEWLFELKPIAHENHAPRACYTALHLKDELRRYAEELKRMRGVSFSVRMGLNSREVVVGKIGDDLRMDYTAQGRTVGLAERMEELASPGGAHLTEHTAKLVSEFFRLRDLGPFEIRGVCEPLGVFELEGIVPLRTRLEAARSRGFSRFSRPQRRDSEPPGSAGEDDRREHLCAANDVRRREAVAVPPAFGHAIVVRHEERRRRRR